MRVEQTGGPEPAVTWRLTGVGNGTCPRRERRLATWSQSVQALGEDTGRVRAEEEGAGVGKTTGCSLGMIRLGEAHHR